MPLKLFSSCNGLTWIVSNPSYDLIIKKFKIYITHKSKKTNKSANMYLSDLEYWVD